MELRMSDGRVCVGSFEDVGLVGEHYVSKFTFDGRVLCSLISRDAVIRRGAAARFKMDTAVLQLHGVRQVLLHGVRQIISG